MTSFRASRRERVRKQISVPTQLLHIIIIGCKRNAAIDKLCVKETELGEWKRTNEKWQPRRQTAVNWLYEIYSIFFVPSFRVSRRNRSGKKLREKKTLKNERWRSQNQHTLPMVSRHGEDEEYYNVKCVVVAKRRISFFFLSFYSTRARISNTHTIAERERSVRWQMKKKK